MIYVDTGNIDTDNSSKYPCCYFDSNDPAVITSTVFPLQEYPQTTPATERITKIYSLVTCVISDIPEKADCHGKRFHSFLVY